MYDLDRLSEEQRQEYYLAACEYLRIPPELNVLAFHWMDQGDGVRKLVLYAKKGATDIIRNNLGISVIDLRKEAGNGEVTWVVKGQNKEGRTEMSSGSKSVQGLRGRELESAIMWAQTKALRRMTLQFVGGGILDETEIAEPTTTDIKNAVSLAEVAAQPSVPQNDAPGREFVQVTGDPKRDFPEGGRLLPTKAQVENAKKKTQTPTFDKPFTLTPVSEDMSFDPSTVTRLKQDSEGRPLCDDGTIVTGDIVKDIGKSMTFTLPPSAPVVPLLQPTPEMKKLVDDAVKADKAQRAAFRDKLLIYTGDIFPKAGMIPDEHGGVGMKVRSYILRRYGRDIPQLSSTQWEDLFVYFEEMLKTKGAAELVKIIDSTVANA